ncbi:MAG TPA: sensor histidine kinase [Candidatus Acidoferrum sp.]|nr:sensor histidine kinase [Candidatus Acidoferrum sp.]
MLYPRSKKKSGPDLVSDHKWDSAEDEPKQRISDEVLQSLIAAQERELGKIARELHDDICQRLAMLSLKIEKATNAWASGQQQVGEMLEQIRNQCSGLAGDVQALSHELHPAILDNLGLVTAVRSFCREIAELSGAKVDLTITKVPDFLPREVSLSLFRLIQEALHNSLKYSGEKYFQVRLQGDLSGIQLEVTDHGVGFDATKIRNGRGLGLISMRERIQLLNGTLHIDSKLDAGTRIYARVPLTSELKVLSAAAN